MMKSILLEEEWEENNKNLIKEIESYCREYELMNKEDFYKNEFNATKEMMQSMKTKFKKDIKDQIIRLIELNETHLK